jgi:hypothetical protein
VASALPRFSVRSNRNSLLFEGIGAKWLWLVLFLDSVYEVIEIHCSFLIVASNST